MIQQKPGGYRGQRCQQRHGEDDLPQQMLKGGLEWIDVGRRPVLGEIATRVVATFRHVGFPVSKVIGAHKRVMHGEHGPWLVTATLRIVHIASRSMCFTLPPTAASRHVDPL